MTVNLTSPLFLVPSWLDSGEEDENCSLSHELLVHYTSNSVINPVQDFTSIVLHLCKCTPHTNLLVMYIV